MSGENNLDKLLKTMKPEQNEGDYVFSTVQDLNGISIKDIVMLFHEAEAPTVILKKETADQLKLEYSAVFSWITLTVHSSLEAVGLTAAFSNALAAAGISCNVVAAYYHDHIFVGKNDSEKAMVILNKFQSA